MERGAWWARLDNGLKAYNSLRGLLIYNTNPNLLTTGPPISLDGNFGFSAAVAEMLIQSHGDSPEFLPALPKAWQNGSVKGLRIRGNKTVDMTWKDGKIVSKKVY